MRKLTVIWMICQPLLFLDLMLWWSFWDLDISMNLLYCFSQTTASQPPGILSYFYLRLLALHKSLVALQLQFLSSQHLPFSSPALALQAVKIPMTSSCSSFAFVLTCLSLSTPPLSYTLLLPLPKQSLYFACSSSGTEAAALVFLNRGWIISIPWYS